MNNIKRMLAGTAGLFIASVLVGGPNENASLQAVVNAGALEITPASVSGTFNPVGGAVTVTAAAQTDALLFNVDGITINDLNGDGLGWQLTATPPATLASGGNTLPIGTNAGFNNPSDAPNSTVLANTVTYTLTTGVSGYTIDYDVAYTVPALAAAGTYTGTIAFAVVAN